MIYARVGETRPWSIALKENGRPVDLTLASLIELYAEDSEGTNMIDGASASVDGDATLGVIEYEPEAVDVDAVGSWEIIVKVTFADGKVYFFPSDDGAALWLYVSPAP